MQKKNRRRIGTFGGQPPSVNAGVVSGFMGEGNPKFPEGEIGLADAFPRLFFGPKNEFALFEVQVSQSRGAEGGKR